MNLTKKTLAFLLAAVLSAGVFAGCGGGSSSSSTGTSAGGVGGTDFNYSDGLDEHGRWAGVTALDLVKLGDYKGVEVPADVHTVKEEDVDAQVQSMLSSYATTNQVLDREVKDGDTVNIDYVGKVDGAEFEGGSTGGNGTSVTIGVTTYIDDFLEQLIGHKPGDSFDVEVTFPDNYAPNPDLSGKDAVFATTINYIEEKITPELNDEFVKEHLTETYGWKTADEVLAQVRSDLQWNATAQYLWDKLLDEAEVSEVPQSMIDYQLDRTVAEYGLAAQSYGMTLEQALSSVGVSTKEELGKKYADDLKEQARQGLVMQAVAEDAAIDVGEEDVAAYFKEFMYLDDYSSYTTNYGDGYVRMTVLNRKVLNYLVDNAVLA